MLSDLEPFLETLIGRAFRERPPDIAPWFFDYFAGLREPDGRRRYARALLGDLWLAGVKPRGRVMVDAGSGFGVTLLCLARLDARVAVGIEAFPPMAFSFEHCRREYAPNLPARVVRASVHEIPLASGSVDFVYCNEALSHFLDPHAFLAESWRVLGKGGTLMVCDGNNALNPLTVSQVKQVWRRFEEGPPAEDFHGHRIEVPYRERRRAMVADALPGLTEAVVRRLAWGTFGLHGTAVVERARDLLAAGNLPKAPPETDRCPVDPDKGDHIENLIDPRDLARELRSLGFSVRVVPHFGGARAKWVAAANRALRTLGPLSLRWARSVKVVARKG